MDVKSIQEREGGEEEMEKMSVGLKSELRRWAAAASLSCCSLRRKLAGHRARDEKLRRR
jgi:hypothetical protein